MAKQRSGVPQAAALPDALKRYRPQPGDLIFDLNADWRNLRPLKVISRDDKLFVADPTEAARPIASVACPAPMMVANPQMWSRLPELLSPFRTVFRALVGLLYETKTAPPVAIDRLVNLTRSPPGFIEYVMRAGVASGLVRVAAGKRLTLELGEILRRNRDQARYASSFGGDLAQSYGRLQYLISHGPTIGHHHESLFRSLLTRQLPDRYHVATGFIAGLFEGRRPQIDVIVYDRLDYSPMFREGDLVVVDIRAVRALVEVKSRLTKKTLLEGLELLHDATHMEVQDPPFFKGVFAFEGLSDPKIIGRHVRDFYVKVAREGRPHGHFYGPVDAIGVRGRTAVFSMPAPKDNQTRLHSIKAEATDSDEPTAHFLSTLFGFLDVPPRSKHAAQVTFDANMTPISDLGVLNRRAWRPTMSTGAMPTAPAALADYVRDIEAWRQGLALRPRAPAAAPSPTERRSPP